MERVIFKIPYTAHRILHLSTENITSEYKEDYGKKLALIKLYGKCLFTKSMQ